MEGVGVVGSTVVGIAVGASVGEIVESFTFDGAHVNVRLKLPLSIFVTLSTATRYDPPPTGGVNDTDEAVPKTPDPVHAPLWLSLIASICVPSLLYSLSTVSKVCPPHVLNVREDWLGEGATEIL